MYCFPVCLWNNLFLVEFSCVVVVGGGAAAVGYQLYQLDYC